jgi:hypothetical protein
VTVDAAQVFRGDPDHEAAMLKGGDTAAPTVNLAVAV